MCFKIPVNNSCWQHSDMLQFHLIDEAEYSVTVIKMTNVTHSWQVFLRAPFDPLQLIHSVAAGSSLTFPSSLIPPHSYALFTPMLAYKAKMGQNPLCLKHL